MFPFTSPIVTVALHLGMAVLVYYDQRLNGRSGVGWACLVFFTGGWGFLVYILFNRDTLQLAAQRFRGKSLEDKLESTIERPARIRPDQSELGLPPTIKIEAGGFSDQQLEALMSEGKPSAARRYLENILKVAKEMGDEDTIEKYRKYAERFAELEQSSRGRLVDDRDAT